MRGHFKSSRPSLKPPRYTGADWLLLIGHHQEQEEGEEDTAQHVYSSLHVVNHPPVLFKFIGLTEVGWRRWRTMLRCVAGRLCAPALEQTLGLHKANRARCVTLTLHKGHTFECSSRSLCGVSAGSTPAHLRKRLPQTDSCGAAGFVPADWRRLERVLDSEGGHLDLIWPWSLGWRRRHSPLSSRAEPLGHVTFTGNGGVSISRTMHVRASSTAAAPRRSDDREEVSTTGTNLTEERNLKGSSTSSPSREKAPESSEPEGGKPSKTQQLKKVFKEYGAVGVSFHIGISLMSLGMFYLLISSGLDMAALLCKLGFSEAVVQSKMAAGTSTFVLAYAVHKLFAPVRISITLVSVPLIVRYFRKTGLFKPPPPSP